MGITGELMKNAFSKNRSFGTTHDTNVMRNHAVERKRWASVRSYLCGDEFSSILAEEDLGSRRSSKAAVDSVVLEASFSSARTSKATIFSSRIDDDSTSVKGSETTVTQPISDQNSSETLEDDGEKTKLPSENEAAVVIQSAFRSFMARRQIKDVGDQEQESVATSVEVQTGNSVVEVEDPSESFTHRMKHHKGARVQPSKLKPKDWDDSTVSSNISKMRLQNRLEASTRRERALAYAFSQQDMLKKETKCEVGERNRGKHELELARRWMATRQHDTSFGDISKQYEQLNGNQKLMVKSRVISDLAGEEKESCGSNEVSMHFDNVSLSSKTAEKSYSKPVRNRVKATSVSRRKKSTRYGLTNGYCKVNTQRKREIRCEDQQ